MKLSRWSFMLVWFGLSIAVDMGIFVTDWIFVYLTGLPPLIDASNRWTDASLVSLAILIASGVCGKEEEKDG